VSSDSRSAATTDNSVPFFTPAPGDPDDACPNCGIHRQHAGNPEACGEGYSKPGCFSEESYARDEFPL
jgi:hypothetical protein